MMYSICMNKYENYQDDASIREEIIRKRKADRRKRRLISASIALILCLAIAFGLGKLLGSAIYNAYNKEVVNVMSDSPLVKAAQTGIGNKGGEPYWSWYDFDAKVDWCACFVSWAMNETGAIEAGNAPKFAYVPDGINWFVARDQFIESNQTPSSGDLIFFDWDQDGGRDHVGIIASVKDNKIFTIEGNSSDRCRVKVYSIADPVIYGYGHIKS